MFRRLVSRPSAWLILLAAVAFLLAGRGDMGPFVQAQGNPITVENGLTGNPSSEWDVSGSGDPSIQGFASDISVDKGQPVQFKIKTVSASYKIDIYRLGYYGGAGARLIAGNLSPSATLPQTQPACSDDAVTGLFDCGNWAVSASWSTVGAVSGIYIAKLTRIDTGGSSHIVFIVRDDARQADVVVQTSDTTWQAYNQYGHGSLYCGGPKSNAGTVYSCAGRAFKVSYNRPIDTRGHDATSFVFNAEYPMVRWLEANGYDVKYISGVDTERNAATLIGAKKPKAFFSVGHDEYWSAGQRASVEAARNVGVSLAFFSGNEIYWKTRFENSVDGTSTPYRTLVSYKDTLGGIKLDPMLGVSTGTWRDTRFGPPLDGGRPENSVTGTIWTVNSGTSAISVPASMASLRFWRNTSVAGLTSGAATLGTDTLGYEWDEDLDNGARPAGVIHLSSATVSGVEKILDFGETVGIGTATHNMTLYRHASGALVFGAGTVQYAWGLDGNHDRGSAAPNLALQQATMNLLADMGAQPGTVQSGLIASSASADVARPTSTITAPVAGATIGSGDRVTITGTASDSGGVVAAVEVSVDGGSTWHTAQGTTAWSYDWSPGAPGTVTIRTRAVDDSANQETIGAGTAVSVVPSTCPCTTLWSAGTVPAAADANDPSGVELGLKFRTDLAGIVTGVRFYKSANNLGTHTGSLWTSTGTLLAQKEFDNLAETPSGWQEVLFDSPVSVLANTTYVVSYHTNVGHYSASGAYFSSQGVDRSPLHAPTSSTVGGNGVYRYGAVAFPTDTFNATNYWVDLVFSSVADTTAPMIGDLIATPVDSSTALITWTTNEQATSNVDYSTDGTFPAAQTLTVSDAAYVTAHSIRLTGLSPTTVYFVRVRSTDRAGNQAAQPAFGPQPPPVPGGPPYTPPGFTTPSPTLHDTTTSDFNAGTLTSTYVSETGDGEIIIAPATATEFSGSVMPANWSTNIWSFGGTAVVSGGHLTVDGARVAQEQADVFAGRSLEFVATFTGDPYQHSGYGQTLASTTEPLALFSTSWVDVNGTPMAGGSLAVRTFAGSGVELSTNLGIGFFNAPHRYRIDWQAGGVTYYVDGAPVATHAMPIAGSMRPVAASDFNAFSGNIVVDWVRSSPYTSAGSFLSRVFDAGAAVNWQNISWAANTPAGTTIAISVRTGGTPTPDATWSAFAPVGPGPITMQSRYIQYRAEMATADPNQTPALSDVLISGSVLPPTPPPPSDQTISFAALGGKTFGDPPFAVTATATSGLPVTFAILSGPATIAGNMVTITGGGNVTVRASQAGGSIGGITYKPAADVDRSFVVSPGSQTITFGPLSAKTFGDPAFLVSATSSSGLAVSFSIVSGPATLLGNTVTITGAGTVTVRASQAGNANYTAATPVDRPFVVSPANQTIAFAALANKVLGTPPFAVSATASSGLPVTFSIVSGPATIAGNTVTITGAGIVKVRASQAGNANYTAATPVDQSFTVTAATSPSTVTVSSSNSNALFGVPITLTATVVPASATGSVTFKDGATTLGAGAITAGAATITTASLSVGTHPITAVYGGSTAVTGSTSAVFTQTISASAKVAVTFAVQALQDDTKKPKVQTLPVPNALVKVFTTTNACVGNIFLSLNPKKWGQIFDGTDGVGGVDGCPVISVGTYGATGTTNAAGQVTITVPPLDLSWTNQYIVIGRATNFDYVKTATSPDPLYSAYPVLMVAANTTRDVPLSLLATFNGKILPGKQTEFFGSYLNIVQPEYMDWTENQEQYPFVMVAQGGWDLTTSVTPPEGFVPDAPAISTSVANTTSAVQFTMTDVGSSWTETTVNQTIVHDGLIMSTTSTIPMIDKKATTAKNDSRKVMHDSAATMLDVMVNDKVNHLRKPITITGITQALNGTVVLAADGLNVSYAPVAGYSGVDTFTYTITDAIGDTSTATVSVTVLATPQVSVRNATVVEGNDGTTPATINVLLSNQSLDTVTVDYQTMDGTARAGLDYQTSSGTVTFAPLVTSMPITVPILGDILAEFDEKFSVQLSNPTNATIAAAPGGDITIADDDPPEISIAPTASIVEGNTGSNNVAVVVTLSQPHSESVWVNYATSDGTAVAGSDYLNTTGTLQFYPNTTTKTIYVPVLGDTIGEKNETFYVDLTVPLNGTLTASHAVVTIVNDDSSSQVFSTAADFGAGTLTPGAYLSETTGGEIMLAPSQGAEFSGTSLPAGWVVESPGGGSPIVAGGQLVADGAALLAPAMTGSGPTLEFVAAFSGANQSIGFGTSSALASPVAMFVIGTDRQLYARSVNGTKTLETLMGGIDWLGKPLRYQITWNAGTAQYYINGTLMITHSSMAWGAVAMRPLIVDATAGDGALVVDWIRSTPYAGAGGTYTSPVFDAGDSVLWQKLTTTSTVPSGTTSTITYRTGSTPVPDGTWTSFTALGTGGTLAGSSQYMQFAIQMSTTSAAKTPLVQDVTVQFKKQ